LKPIDYDDTDTEDNAWKQLCATLTTQEEIEAAAMRIIDDPDDPAWWGCFLWMAEVAFGKPRSRTKRKIKWRVD
jgi:hypothetical protein